MQKRRVGMEHREPSWRAQQAAWVPAVAVCCEDAARMLMAGCVGCETKAECSGMRVGRRCLRGQTGSSVGVVEKEKRTTLAFPNEPSRRGAILPEGTADVMDGSRECRRMGREDDGVKKQRERLRRCRV